MHVFYRIIATLILLAGWAVTRAEVGVFSKAAPYGKTVCEGRTWDYYLYRPWHDQSRLLCGYHFDGTYAVDGQEYAVFCDGDGEPIALMREEERKLYLYVPKRDDAATPGHDILVGDMSGDVTGEILIYDFSLGPGEGFVSPAFDNLSGIGGMLMGFEVACVSEFDFAGEVYCTQEFRCTTAQIDHIFKAVEGAGNVSGLLPCPQIGIKITGPDSINYQLVRVTDENGGVLYEDEKFWAGVSAPVASEQPAPIYDMLGRRVAQPVAGGLYVRDGRKVVWK